MTQRTFENSTKIVVIKHKSNLNKTLLKEVGGGGTKMSIY